MITSAQREFILASARIPEQLPGYVTAVSGAEPDLLGDYILYRRPGSLILVGYPLSGEAGEDTLQAALDECRRRFTPNRISLIAPAIPPAELEKSGLPVSQDDYYCLDLEELILSKKLRSLLKRAGHDLSIEIAERWGRDHQRLVDGFLRSRTLDQGTLFIFKRLPRYVRTGGGVLVEARDRAGRLVAFDIADFGAAASGTSATGAVAAGAVAAGAGAGQYAFYMFNFMDREHAVPGASDLLLFEVIASARQQGKHYLNLGLGINPGVVFFKEKWGAVKFMPYRSILLGSAGESAIDDLLDLLPM